MLSALGHFTVKRVPVQNILLQNMLFVLDAMESSLVMSIEKTNLGSYGF